jgi:hypothetical protein
MDVGIAQQPPVYQNGHNVRELPSPPVAACTYASSAEQGIRMQFVKPTARSKALAPLVVMKSKLVLHIDICLWPFICELFSSREVGEGQAERQEILS